MNVHRILHPTDFTESAAPAFARALAMAEHYGAELHLLNVTETLGEDPIRGAFDVRMDAEAFYRAQWSAADAKMQEVAATVEERNIALRSVHLRGTKPAPVILDYASDQRVDMIVMGSHGRRGFQRMVAGSVAMEVVRKAEMPVMTVGAKVKSFDGGYFDRVLVPVDFSEHARTALNLAQRFARSFDSELTALHVIEQPNVPSFYATSLELYYGSIGDIKKEAQRELIQLSEASSAVPDAMNYEVRIGHVVDEVMKTAHQIDAGLIVLSTHGATGMPRFFLGSVSERIIRSAEVPVLRLRTITTGGDAAEASAASAN